MSIYLLYYFLSNIFGIIVILGLEGSKYMLLMLASIFYLSQVLLKSD